MNVFALDGHEPVLPKEGQYWIAPGAQVMGQVELKRNSSIWYNVVLRGDVAPIVVGENTNIQDLTLVHADGGRPTLIGDSVTIGHSTVLHGCEIGDGSMIGIGAVVLSGAKIGRGCVIGARALVTEGMVAPDNSLLMGAPARVVRQVEPELAARVASGTARYVDNWKRHAAALAAAAARS